MKTQYVEGKDYAAEHAAWIESQAIDLHEAMYAIYRQMSEYMTEGDSYSKGVRVGYINALTGIAQMVESQETRS